MSEIKIPRIEISATQKKVIAEKYDITTQAVRNALKYHSNSPSAQVIRAEAQKLLEKQAKSVKIKVARN